MHIKKNNKILIYFFLLFFVGSINNLNFEKYNFSEIKKINVFGLSNLENQSIIKNINNIKLDNIFFLNDSEIKKIIEKNKLVESYKVSKIYPATLNIDIQKTKFLAKINLDSKTFIIGSNGKLSSSENLNKILPFVFGKPEINEFLNFKKIIDQSNILYDQIKNLYFYPSKRWDIELKNNLIIKLPANERKNSLNIAFDFISNSNLKDFKTIDIRTKNQIIINE